VSQQSLNEIGLRWIYLESRKTSSINIWAESTFTWIR